MNRSRLQRTLLVLAIVAAVVFALYQVDLLTALRRLHGMQ
jgi:preprotein translocase subunit SecE